MAGGRRWTVEDEELLAELWGRSCVKSIAKRLQRSETAVIVQKERLKLGSFLEAGEYISLNQLICAVTGSKCSYSYKTTSWVKNRGFPVKERQVKDCRFKVVYIKDFWKWAEQNRDFLDFSKMEENILGEEPAWVKEQRRQDAKVAYAINKAPWTPAEDKLLLSYLQEYRYTYLQLSRLLHRTSGAIQRRVCDLGYKERPIKADNMVLWTPEEMQQLAELIWGGAGYETASFAIGKSSKAIRGKVDALYKTERLDVVRKMMLDPSWGSGAPVPTVNRAKRTAAVKQDLAKLAGLIAYRRNQLGWSPFWQKEMCQHWDDMTGCTANETDCDTCTSFQRIQPQYCRRCGSTVFIRRPLINRLCDRCRKQRKAQYFHKMNALGQEHGRTEEHDTV